MSEFAPDELEHDLLAQVAKGIARTKLAPTDALYAIRDEFNRARELFPRPFVNAHEAHSIIQEEFDEFQREVYKNHKNRNPAKMRNELVQLAAMCLRALVEVDAHDP